MNCPVCNIPFIVLELNQIEIDYCTKCSGIWLDSGELELLLDSNEKNKLLNSLLVVKNIPEKSIRCPVCSKKMEKVFFSENEKIILDRCRRFHGLWFNKGELQKFVEYGSADSERKVSKLLKEMFSNNLNS